MTESDNWRDEAIKKDMLGSLNRLGKGRTIIVTLLKIKSLGDDKRLKIEMNANLYGYLNRYKINLEDPRFEKLFDEDRDKFMKMIKGMGAKAEIVDEDFGYRLLFGKDNSDEMTI